MSGYRLKVSRTQFFCRLGTKIEPQGLKWVLTQMLAYKSAVHIKKRVVVTLEIPEDALTNLGRSNIVCKETAKYRTNKAKVLKIEDEEGNEYLIAKSAHHHRGKRFYYVVGEEVVEPNFRTDLTTVCAQGIHFFLERRVAELYEKGKVQNGVYQTWYENGQKHFELNFKDSLPHGSWLKWHKTGELHCQYEYINGVCVNKVYNPMNAAIAAT